MPVPVQMGASKREIEYLESKICGLALQLKEQKMLRLEMHLGMQGSRSAMNSSHMQDPCSEVGSTRTPPCCVHCTAWQAWLERSCTVVPVACEKCDHLQHAILSCDVLHRVPNSHENAVRQATH